MVKYYEEFKDENVARDVLFFREMRLNEAYRNEKNCEALLETVGKECFEMCNSKDNSNLIERLGMATAMQTFAKKATDEAAGLYYNAVELWVRTRYHKAKSTNHAEIKEIMERTDLGADIWKRASNEAAEIRAYLEAQRENRN